ncbi:MAG: histidine kinase [Bacteroidota bacterium]
MKLCLLLKMLFYKRLFVPFAALILAVVLFLVIQDFKGDYTNHLFKDPYVYTSLKSTLGDAIDWKNKDFDDTSWEESIPHEATHYWLRIHYDFSKKPLTKKPAGIMINGLLGSYEVYWNGQLIGSNGVYSISKLKEIPGSIDASFLIPEQLLVSSEHTLAIRVSNHYKQRVRNSPYVRIVEYRNNDFAPQLLFMHVIAGIALIISIYYFLTFFSTYRENTYLFFALITLLVSFLIFIEYSRQYIDFPHTWQYPRLLTISGLVISITLLISNYFLEILKLSHKWVFNSLQVCFIIFTLLSVSDFDKQTFYLVSAASIIGFLSTLYGYIRNIDGWEYALFSLIPFILISFFFVPFFYDLLLFLSFVPFIFIQLLWLNKRLNRQKRDYERYMLESSRLQTELLKRNIQPHFILNTLNSLISWVDESPKVAIRFIETLAEEFKILSDFTSKQMVPIRDELDLCTTHLELMSYRNEKVYHLDKSVSDLNLSIPPAILLTILENGLTHNLNSEKEISFKVSQNFQGSKAIITLFSPGHDIERSDNKEDGTGIKYIKARLTESYGNDWKFDSNRTEDGWKSVIIIPIR